MGKRKTTEVKPYANDLELFSDYEQIFCRLAYLNLLLADKLLSNKMSDDTKRISRSAITRRMRDTKKVIENLKQEMEARIVATQTAGTNLALVELSERYGLCWFERSLLVLLLLNSIDDSLARRIGWLRRNRREELNCVRIIIILFFGTGLQEKINARNYLRYDAPLSQNGLIDLSYNRHQNTEADFWEMSINIPGKIASKLLGTEAVSEIVSTYSAVTQPEIDISQVVLAGNKKDELIDLVRNRDEYLAKRKAWGFDDIISYGKGTIMLFFGDSGTGKTMMANALAKATGRRLMNVDLFKVMRHSCGPFEESLSLIFSEARLQNAVIFFDEADELFSDRRTNGAMPLLLRNFEKLDGLCILATNRAIILDHALERRILLRVEFETPTAEMREQIWRNHIPKECPIADDIDFKALAEDYDFSGGFIKNAVLLALNSAITRPENQKICMADLVLGARVQRSNRLEKMSDSTVPKVAMSDVVLATDTRRQVEDFIAACKQRNRVFADWGLAQKMSYGKAMSALFIGDSGLGKTLSAEAVAFELGFNLQVVSLPAVVSKYVGETEKNLKKSFADAKASNAILFFDEADALFGSRLDEGSSNAFFVNGQINSLLQEVEQYDGIVILATNRPHACDVAFSRRLRYKITFHAPDADLRLALWRTMIPPSAPISDNVDFRQLAEAYEYSGGTIRNVVVRACFKAATDGKILTQKILLESCEEEQPLESKKRMGFAVG